VTETQQKVAVITGGSQGIGAGIVDAYRRRGWAVVANSLSIRPSTDPDILTVAGDVSERATADRIMSQALDCFGRVDTLVNNAGVFVSKPLTDYTAEDYALVTGVNLAGFFWCASMMAPGSEPLCSRSQLMLRSVLLGCRAVHSTVGLALNVGSVSRPPRFEAAALACAARAALVSQHGTAVPACPRVPVAPARRWRASGAVPERRNRAGWPRYRAVRAGGNTRGSAAGIGAGSDGAWTGTGDARSGSSAHQGPGR
jgi:short chain dehydrogenase